MAPPATKRRRTDDAGPIITDARFANIQSDPRYRLPGRKEKIKVDKRFARALKDEEFTKRAKVDRYGRPLESDSEKKRLKRKYEFEENELESDEPDDDEEVQRELTRVNQSRDLLREGKAGSSSSDDKSSSEDDSELEEDLEDVAGPGVQQANVPLGEISSRIAVVNLDWDNIRAEDLMAVFNSFLPATGRLLKVSIYPSEFGRERMEREEMEGPPKEIFATNGDNMEVDISSDDDNEDDEGIKASIVKPDDGSEFDSKALRQYQLDRLRYFYAILTFSSASTAKAIYDAVDGTEYLSTANFFDLRFVPDDTDFSADAPKDECKELSSGYKPNEFVTDALQHSKVKLTWDAEDGGRKEAQARAFRGGRKEIDENDLRAYLGSDTDNESDDADETDVAYQDQSQKLSKKDAERQRMRALLGLAPEPVKPSKKDKNAPTGNIQITFSSGLSGLADAGDSDDVRDIRKTTKKRSVFENSPEPEETTMEKYIRKEKERKQRRKEKAKSGRSDAVSDEQAAAEEGGDDDDDDLGFNDPFFAEPLNDQKTTNKIRKEERLKKRKDRELEEAASAKQRAELELLMADDNNNNDGNRRQKSTENHEEGQAPKGRPVKHFDMNEIEKAEKAMTKKGKKKDKKSRGGSQPSAREVLEKDDFEMNTSDPRFSRLFENHEFAIDPTNSRFKQTKGMKALLDEGRKRKAIDRKDLGEINDDDDNGVGKQRTHDNKNPKTVDENGVMKLVEKLKRKHK